VTAGNAVSFQGSASISDNSAMSYSWSFGDGASAAVQGPVSHAYAAAGTYTATFTATSNQGQTASATRVITVNPAPDTQAPTISVSESGTSGTVSFSASATDNVGVTRVEFYVDGSLVGTDAAAPYTYAYNSTQLANGSHSLVGKAYDAAGNVGTSGSVAFSINNSTSGGGTTTQILGNPGFETGTASPWVASSGVLDNGTSEAAHSGSWKAWMDGYGSSHTDTLYQQVAIDPTATAASLSFWLHIDTAETTTTAANDTLKLQVRNSSGTVLATLATYSNLNANTGFAQKTFDLSAYKGQTIQVYLVGTENGSNQTSFVVDDFALNVTTSGSGSGGGDTVPPTVSASETGTSGTITLSATATDNVGVTKVEFYVDGALKGTDTASPYTMTLDSTTLANGSHSLVAKAYDAAGNVGTSATASFSVSNSSTTPTNVISNGGFESGTTGWTQSSGVIAQNGTSEPAHAGTWDAWLDGYGSSHTDTLYQTVSIPASATTATLAFWLHVDTAETTTTSAYDTLKVQVRNSSGTVLATLGTFSNLDAVSGYVQKTFDLSAYKGQTVQIYFNGTEDSSQQTSFVLDDVSLNVQ
ncbi:MAG TPA: Ig-like domain-containing protein, partial [Holophagaceae bacterium]